MYQAGECAGTLESERRGACRADQTEITIDGGTVYEQGRERTRLETAQISLNDCLACSGCVTSAETVLIGTQSIDQVTDALRHMPRDCGGGRIAVASISPQSLASLALRYARPESPSRPQLPQAVLLERIAKALRVIGFDAVTDTTFARVLAVREHVREFRERRSANVLPMLAGSCPGWVCYAEKAQAELLPYVAQAKSPQQFAGLVAKHVVGGTLGRSPHDVYHVTVMPCYDKKLEASRPDHAENGVPEVDCVITTGELHDLLYTHGFDPYADREIEGVREGGGSSNGDGSLTHVSFPQQVEQPGSSSGGYLFAIMHDVWREHPDAVLESRVIRSSDYTEYVLRLPHGTIFKGAVCYGFRNLQNLVRKVQRETGARGARGRGLARRVRGGAAAEEARYDYVEVMACPGGCVNGGGQMRPPGTHAPEQSEGVGWQGTSREWVALVEQSYWDGTDGATSADTLAAYDPAALDAAAAPVEAALRGHMRTEYHGVQPETNGLTVQW